MLPGGRIWEPGCGLGEIVWVLRGHNPGPLCAPRSLRSLKRRGTCINFGASSGQPAPVEVLELAEAGSVFLTRPHLADYMASREEIAWRASDLFEAYQEGKLEVTTERCFPLAAASDAHRLLEGRGTRGKILLRVEE